MADTLEFKRIFKGDIVEPNDTGYSDAISRWSSSNVKRARYVVFPKDEQDVVVAVKFAVNSTIPLAVKGGGHNPSGASSIEDGLCIDLSRYLNTARVEPEQRVAHVGGGALWETVDKATIAHGLGTPGGTVNHTGVGGLTLAGGYGWLSGEYGLVIDNLVQATIVTADGSILTASETSNTDLFWGIRGGGGNFGVVTEFVFRLHPQRQTVFAGTMIFPPPLLPKIAEYIDSRTDVSNKEGFLLGLVRGPDRLPAILLAVFFNGSKEEGQARFKFLFDLGPVVNTVDEIPYEQLNSILNMGATPGKKYYMSGTSLRSPLLPHIADVFGHVVTATNEHPSNPDLPPFSTMIGYELFPTKITSSVSPDAMAFRNRGTQVNVLIMIIWDHDEENGEDIKFARKLSNEVKEIIQRATVKQPGETENQGYGNYVSENPDAMRTAVHSLWRHNYPRLRELKTKYDPKCIFSRWMPIEPAD